MKYVADVKKASQPRAFDYRESIMLWNFSDPETVNKWDCISDKDINGYSNAHFGPNRKGTQRYLCTIDEVKFIQQLYFALACLNVYPFTFCV